MTETARCGSCGAPIVWARHGPTLGGVSPFDAEPGELGTWTLERTGDGLAARYAGRAVALELLEPLSRFTSHFATCPNAAAHRGASRG